MSACPECGGAIVWDDVAGSDLCSLCGTLSDPSQSVLASQSDYQDPSRQYDMLYNPTAPVSLSNVTYIRGKGKQSFDPFGQSKEARNGRKKLAMRETIKSLASAMSAPGFYERAVFLFEAAMEKGQFRWGRKADVVAATSLAIAFRESNQTDRFHELAAALQLSHNSISRMFATVVTLLDLQVSALPNPGSQLPTLHTYVHELINDPIHSAILPEKLAKTLKSLSLSSIVRIADSLSVLTSNTFSHLTVGPTACALFIVAAEAEAGVPLPSCADFATILGRKVGLSGRKVVMGRCKVIRDEIDKWRSELPWLENSGDYGHKRLPAGKRKKKMAVQGIKDIVAMEMDKWGSKVPRIERPSSSVDNEGSDTESTTTESSSSKRKLSSSQSSYAAAKRAKLPSLFEQTSRFLLNPLSTALPSTEPSRLPPSKQILIPPHPTETDPPPDEFSSCSSNSATHRPLLAFTNYLLSGSSSFENEQKIPSRLRVLAAERGGAESERIDDDELFDPGELESLFREPAERDHMRTLWGWEHGVGEFGWQKSCPEGSGDADEPIPKRKKQKVAPDDVDAQESRSGSKRINMDALEKLFSGDAEDVDAATAQLSLLEEDIEDDKDDSSLELFPYQDFFSGSHLGVDQEDEDRYQQEYE